MTFYGQAQDVAQAIVRAFEDANNLPKPLAQIFIRLSSDNYSSPSTTTIIPDCYSIQSSVNDNYFSRSAGQLVLPGRSAAWYGSHAG